MTIRRVAMTRGIRGAAAATVTPKEEGIMDDCDGGCVKR